MIIGVMQTILIQIFDISRSKKKPRICVKSSRELQDALLYVFAATVAERKPNSRVEVERGTITKTELILISARKKCQCFFCPGAPKIES